ASASGDPSGYGEGQRYLGALTVATDAAGDVRFDATVPGASAGGEAISATATDAAGNTSEFSLWRPAHAGPSVRIAGVPATALEGTPVTLTSLTFDPEGDTNFTYNWSVTKDGNPYGDGEASNFAFTPDDNGTYVVTLVVTDSAGAASGAAQVTLVAGNLNPV